MTSSPKPSYVNISCSVNGYTSFSCYNSSARENLHSHKSSPSLSPCWNGNSETNVLRKSSLELQSDSYKTYFQNDSSQTLAGTTETDCAYLNKSFSSNGESATIMSASNFQESSAMESTLIPSNCRTDRPSTSEPSKSLVQQRIERLYGPAAIVEGIFLHKAKIARNVNNRSIHATEESTCVSSSVYISTLTPGSKLTTKISPKITKKELVKESSVFIDRPKKTNEYIEETRQAQRNSVHLNGFQHSTPVDRKPLNEIKDAAQNVDEVKCSEPTVDKKTEPKGTYFLQVMNKEKTKIQSLIDEAEKTLNDESLSEDAAGKFRATIGKASLLLNQKFEQFHDLCNKNIVQKPDDPLPTTASDLEGFWDLVLIQVDHIYDMFYDIGILTTKEDIKAVNKVPDEGLGVKPKQVNRKTRIGINKGSAIKQSSKKEEAALAREEARKKLAEMKRQARKQMAEQNSQQTVEIFIPDSKD